MLEPVKELTAVTTQPGVFYRDFERETLKHNLIMPSYPASARTLYDGRHRGEQQLAAKSPWSTVR
jgi:hypothetical protein